MCNQLIIIVQLIVLDYGRYATMFFSSLQRNVRPVKQLVKYMIDISMGMHYLAEKGLVHRVSVVCHCLLCTPLCVCVGGGVCVCALTVLQLVENVYIMWGIH